MGADDPRPPGRPQESVTMSEALRRHYEQYPYPRYPLLASLRVCDTYALNLRSLWIYGNGSPPPPDVRNILIAGCGAFAPYPFSLANPDRRITALDLSAQSLKRARLHCLLHGRRNVRFLAGDLANLTVAPGPFGLIDAFGVLHHLDDPLAGLRALVARLAPGGVLRLMLYSRFARREEESLRRAFRLLGVTSVRAVRDMAGRAAPGSRLREFFDDSREADDDAGLADALLHPQVRTYRIDDVRRLLNQAGLNVLRYAHDGALAEVEQEEERLRGFEAERYAPDNFVLYAGMERRKMVCDAPDVRLMLNPCLAGAVDGLMPGTLRIAARFGGENLSLSWSERRFLNRFRKPTPLADLSPGERDAAARFETALFLGRFRGNGGESFTTR